MIRRKQARSEEQVQYLLLHSAHLNSHTLKMATIQTACKMTTVFLCPFRNLSAETRSVNLSVYFRVRLSVW